MTHIITSTLIAMAAESHMCMYNSTGVGEEPPTCQEVDAKRILVNGYTAYYNCLFILCVYQTLVLEAIAMESCGKALSDERRA